MNKVAILDCSHNNSNQINKIITLLDDFLSHNNIITKIVPIKQSRIVSCNECKICMQPAGCEPVKCFHHDQMDDVIDAIEDNDAFIFISDTDSIFSANDTFQRFSKRLAAYYYWPFGTKSSIHRKKIHDKFSILLNYNTTFDLFNKTYETSLEQLKTASIAVGAEPVATLTIKPEIKPNELINEYYKEIELCAYKLLRSLKRAS
mgnify:CR=1 FL=1